MTTTITLKKPNIKPDTQVLKYVNGEYYPVRWQYTLEMLEQYTEGNIVILSKEGLKEHFDMLTSESKTDE